MPKFVVSPRAKEDLKSIGRYTKGRWGKEQRDEYLLSLERRFQWLIDNFNMGRKRDDIKNGYHSFVHRRHVIFYFVSANKDINIIGVVGFSKSLEKYFN